MNNKRYTKTQFPQYSYLKWSIGGFDLVLEGVVNRGSVCVESESLTFGHFANFEGF